MTEILHEKEKEVKKCNRNRNPKRDHDVCTSTNESDCMDCYANKKGTEIVITRSGRAVKKPDRLMY